MEEQKNENVLDLLLRPEIPDARKQLPTAKFEVSRLSALAEKPVIFTLRGLPYNKVRAVQGKGDDYAVHVVLEGCVEPNFRDARLLDETRGLVTPPDVIKAKLTSGEIDELSIEVQKLSGYLKRTLREVKNA